MEFETAPIEDVACEVYEFEHTYASSLACVLGHAETDLLQVIGKMLNTGRRIAMRLVRKRIRDPRRKCYVHHMRVEADDVEEVGYQRAPIRMHESIDIGFSRQDGRTRRMESHVLGDIPLPLLPRLDPPPPPAPLLSQAWGGIRKLWAATQQKPLPHRDDDLICRQKREARLTIQQDNERGTQ